MAEIISDFHHVTAICGDPQDNVEFYSGVLGLRFIKKTVNFDDPGTYHLYYGDAVGTPGSVITFFAWLDAPHGRSGAGNANTIAFSVPADALGFWKDRLISIGVDVNGPAARFDETFISFRDPTGIRLELTGNAGPQDQFTPWETRAVESGVAIRGINCVMLAARGDDSTEKFLEDSLGFKLKNKEGYRARYAVTDDMISSYVDVETPHAIHDGRNGTGVVHHVAFRVEDEHAQSRIRDRLVKTGVDVSAVIDRTYFKSIYFREPGGTLFEIATSGPGFTVDEAEDSLGEKLCLPERYEFMREDLEGSLPNIQPPGS